MTAPFLVRREGFFHLPFYRVESGVFAAWVFRLSRRSLVWPVKRAGVRSVLALSRPEESGWAVSHLRSGGPRPGVLRPSVLAPFLVCRSGLLAKLEVQLLQ